ncbi:uncharacterized protein M6B38_373675 [Iris pallida]|uniref:Uncharacterized protein n=1 Tax=Iris pallida TaxID=29817 RepID=A0AAX6GD18_IRIPA|nr:uncharacterized protein M6B38_164160 [Iris pallida]KAJ6822208.1 uncharacterized protein M6B38_390385 [Iris pallida]KAJ6826138.1 uncharacterized protein M6B38_373675 [Iris pallida]
MEEKNKKAAKSFVDKYFPVKQPNPLKSDILDGIFPPKNHQDPWKKQGGAGVGQSSHVHNTKTTTSGCNSQGSHSKGQGTYHKGNSGSIFLEASDPCHMGSSVDYGCRDYYPSSKQHPVGYDREKERKDGYDYPDPENSRGEWWQGSLYY